MGDWRPQVKSFDDPDFGTIGTLKGTPNLRGEAAVGVSVLNTRQFAPEMGRPLGFPPRRPRIRGSERLLESSVTTTNRSHYSAKIQAAPIADRFPIPLV
jgi:hypothetical protein